MSLKRTSSSGGFSWISKAHIGFDVSNVGEILKKLTIIDDSQLQAALDDQKKRGCRIGECLVHLGFIKPEHIQLALDLQKKLRGPDPVAAMMELVDRQMEIQKGVLQRQLDTFSAMPSTDPGAD